MSSNSDLYDFQPAEDEFQGFDAAGPLPPAPANTTDAPTATHATAAAAGAGVAGAAGAHRFTIPAEWLQHMERKRQQEQQVFKAYEKSKSVMDTILDRVLEVDRKGTAPASAPISAASPARSGDSQTRPSLPHSSPTNNTSASKSDVHGLDHGDDKQAHRQAGPQADPSDARQIVHFQVGDYLVTTTMATLKFDGERNYLTSLFDTKMSVLMVDALVAGRPMQVPFVDRDGSVFRTIMQYLRGNRQAVLDLRPKEQQQLYDEADFYGLNGLKELICPPVPEDILEPFVKELDLCVLGLQVLQSKFKEIHEDLHRSAAMDSPPFDKPPSLYSTLDVGLTYLLERLGDSDQRLEWVKVFTGSIEQRQMYAKRHDLEYACNEAKCKTERDVNAVFKLETAKFSRVLLPLLTDWFKAWSQTPDSIQSIKDVWDKLMHRLSSTWKRWLNDTDSDDSDDFTLESSDEESEDDRADRKQRHDVRKPNKRERRERRERGNRKGHEHGRFHVTPRARFRRRSPHRPEQEPRLPWSASQAANSSSAFTAPTDRKSSNHASPAPSTFTTSTAAPLEPVSDEEFAAVLQSLADRTFIAAEVDLTHVGLLHTIPSDNVTVSTPPEVPEVPGMSELP